MNRSVLVRALIALALVAMLAVGSGCSCAKQPAVTPPEDTPPAQNPDDDDPVPEVVPVSAYFLGHSEKVYPVRKDAASDDLLSAALEALLDGPSQEDLDSGLNTTIPEGTILLGASVTGKVATVDLNSEFGTGGGSLSMMARIAQVVFTATQFPEVEQARILIDGLEVTELGGEGISLAQAQTREMWEAFAPVILVEQPVRGDSTKRGEPLTVSGSANTFEAMLRIEIVDANGLVIGDEIVMATSGTGTRGTFEVRFDVPTDAARGVGMIIASYDSAMDGSKVVIDEIPIDLQ